MKINIRKSSERGYSKNEWLTSWHTFSFADYHDPKHMGFHALRVINEDIIAPGRGFGAHPHRNMEIVTFMIDGELEHQDNSGGHEVLRKGEVQRMTAGKGIVHSEINASKKESAHLVQIWIEPSTINLDPGYEQRSFDKGLEREGLTTLVSNDRRDGSLLIHQDALISLGHFLKDSDFVAENKSDRVKWIQLIKGKITAGEFEASTGDALSFEGEGAELLSFADESTFIVFDLLRK